jgi:uncharacterized membrane protein YozB (DUF420 family)
MTHPPDTRKSGTGTDLWRVILAPIVWALHFLICYILAAIYCEKAVDGASLVSLHSAIIVVTLVALGAIGLTASGLWKVRARSLTDEDFDFEHNSPEERHRFLSHVALMLCVLSAVAVIYVALPFAMVADCR